jgi:hypothetical protein
VARGGGKVVQGVGACGAAWVSGDRLHRLVAEGSSLGQQPLNGDCVSAQGESARLADEQRGFELPEPAPAGQRETRVRVGDHRVDVGATPGHAGQRVLGHGLSIRCSARLCPSAGGEQHRGVAVPISVHEPELGECPRLAVGQRGGLRHVGGKAEGTDGPPEPTDPQAAAVHEQRLTQQVRGAGGALAR